MIVTNQTPQKKSTHRNVLQNISLCVLLV